MVELKPEENLSFVLEAVKKLKFEDRPVPELKDEHEVLVQVAWTGICGSDVHYWQNGRIGHFVLNAPMVLGHESSGVITKVGAAVKDLAVGDRVAMEPGVPCRRCEPCKSGRYNLCEEMAFAATPPFDGTLAKYYALPADYCYKLPEGVSLEAGALVEPTSVAVHIVRQAAVSPGDRVIVFGAGPVGLLCAGVSLAFGAASVVMVDIQRNRLEFAQTWLGGGADGNQKKNIDIFIPEKGESAADGAARLKKLANLPLGADVVLEATGAEPCIQLGIAAAKRGGRYVQAGMGRDQIAFPILAACTGELTVRGSFRYGEGDYRLAVRMIADGKLRVEELISRKVAFRDAEKAFEDVRDGVGIKTLIEGVKDS